MRLNPQLHAIVPQGGFDRTGRFLHIPRLDLTKLSRYFRFAGDKSLDHLWAAAQQNIFDTWPYRQCSR